MVRILKSKRGQIPIVSDFIHIFLSVTPKPILALLFIFLITLIAGVILPGMLKLMGYTCLYGEDGTPQLWQVPPGSLLDNLMSNINQKAREIFYQQYILPDDPFPNGDKTYMKVPSACWVDTQINGTDTSGYTSLCTNCTKAPNGFTDEYFGGAFGMIGHEQICVSDGVARHRSFYDSVATKNLCALCEPPVPYHFEINHCTSQDNCYFVIDDPALIDRVTVSALDAKARKAMEKSGGHIVSVDPVNDVVSVQCTANKQPTLYLFTIEMFNRTMWIVLLLGYAIVGFAYWYWDMTLKH